MRDNGDSTHKPAHPVPIESALPDARKTLRENPAGSSWLLGAVRGGGFLFLVEGTSFPGFAKVLVTNQVTPALFTWLPSDTGVSDWKMKTGPAVLSPKPQPWRHRGAMAVTARLITGDDTPVVRHPSAPAPEKDFQY